MKYSAVIFDMDGLMFDSEPIWLASWEPAFAAHGLELKPGLAASCMGSARDATVKIVTRCYDEKEAARQAVLDHFDLAEQEMLAHGAPAKPGLFELLGWLAEQGIPLAVASSSASSLVEACLGLAGVRELFSVTATGDEGLPSKPNPALFLAAAERLGVAPSEVLVLEDSVNGIRAAAAGGFDVIAVPDMVEPDDETRALCVARLDSLLDVLEHLKSC